LSRCDECVAHFKKFNWDAVLCKKLCNFAFLSSYPESVISITLQQVCSLSERGSALLTGLPSPVAARPQPPQNADKYHDEWLPQSLKHSPCIAWQLEDFKITVENKAVAQACAVYSPAAWVNERFGNSSPNIPHCLRAEPKEQRLKSARADGKLTADRGTTK
jgi:hypothetical protein